jgi:tetratricopeptide (TPR) repeat protein
MADITHNVRNQVFQSAAIREFNYLIEGGYRLSEIIAGEVIFEKNQTQIIITYDTRSTEMSLSIGADGEKYSLGEILAACGREEAGRYRDPCGSTAAEIDNAIHILAELYKLCRGKEDFLNEAFLTQLRMNRSQAVTSYAAEVRAAKYLPMADAAFRMGRYKVAVEFYEQALVSLSKSQQAKLAYALTQLDEQR